MCDVQPISPFAQSKRSILTVLRSIDLKHPVGLWVGVFVGSTALRESREAAG
ncbi:MAG: hypothetical protein QOG55_3723 [Acidobacteriaceae bacterium]|nr:hypothetical protein [Acidobacteriaceae bacterium]